MHGIRDGRSIAKPQKPASDRGILAAYAAAHRGLPCEWCVLEDQYDEPPHPFQEVHHILGGTRRADQEWNLAAICSWHHQHPTHGFHGSNPSWNAERAFELKLSQGYQLPRAAWAFLAGVDACPTPQPSQRFNAEITRARCEAARGGRS